MKIKSTDRIQFELACMRLAYRQRGPLNRRRPLLPEPRPAFIVGYASAGFILLGIIAALYRSGF